MFTVYFLTLQGVINKMEFDDYDKALEMFTRLAERDYKAVELFDEEKNITVCFKEMHHLP
jgi:hypothetical protein